MEYRCAPIYKYLSILVIFFLFLAYYKCINNDKFLPISVIFVTVIIIIDHMLILNQPHITSDRKEGFSSNNEDDDKEDMEEDMEEDLDDLDEDLLDDEDYEVKSPRKTKPSERKVPKKSNDKAGSCKTCE